MPSALNLVHQAVAQAPDRLRFAQVSQHQAAPTSFASPLYVVFPDFTTDYFFTVDAERWIAATLPAQGTPCLVSTDNQGNLWAFIGTLSAPTTVQGVVTVTTTYGVQATDGVVLANATSAGFTVTLPSAATTAGRTVTVKATNTNTNLVTLACTGVQKIDNTSGLQSTLTLGVGQPLTSATCVSDGSNWQVI